ncbi:MAG: HD domain-containing protein [Oscillospiraceae bacterium]|nr:HD domain-containing protein [Oscillospiraceae bacterium]
MSGHQSTSTNNIDFRRDKWLQKTKMVNGLNNSSRSYAHKYMSLKLNDNNDRIKELDPDHDTLPKIINSIDKSYTDYAGNEKIYTLDDAHEDLFILLVHKIELNEHIVEDYTKFQKEYVPQSVKSFIKKVLEELGENEHDCLKCNPERCCSKRYLDNQDKYDELCDKFGLPFEINHENIYGQKICFGFLLTLYTELLSCKRTRYNREYDRILVSKPFEHLQYKTQVMVNSASDNQRTRLLHSLEVQKCAKTLSQHLGANWEVAEEIAIAHDVGHTPFGHAGEKQLDICLNDRFCGRFAHPLQSVKAIDFLEEHEVSEKYGVRGLLLSRTVLKGILQHDRDSFSNNLGQAGYQLQYIHTKLLEKEKNKITNEDKYLSSIGGLESQIVLWSDKLAFLGHDWEEYSNSGLLDDLISYLNKVYFKIFNAKATFISRSDHQLSSEEKLIKNILNKMDKLNEVVAIKDKNDINENIDKDTLIKAISDLLDTLDEIKDNNEERGYKITSIKSYAALYYFFKVAKAWIELLDVVPMKSEASRDILFVIYTFLKRRVNSRTIMNRVQDLLLQQTKIKLKEFEKYMFKKDKKNIIGEEITEDDLKEKFKEEFAEFTKSIQEEDLICYCNDKFVELRNKDYRQLNKDIDDKDKKYKNQEDLIKRELTKDAFVVDIEEKYKKNINDIDDFKFRYYINSTRVTNMSRKAEQIVKKLFEFFFDSDNFDMLPNEFKSHEKRYYEENYLQDFEKYLKEYLGDRLLEIQHPLNPEDNWDEIGDKIREIDSNVSRNIFQEELKENRHINLQNLGKWIEKKEHIKKVIRARIIADYIASMTDRMATLKYNEIMSSNTKWSTDYNE